MSLWHCFTFISDKMLSEECKLLLVCVFTIQSRATIMTLIHTVSLSLHPNGLRPASMEECGGENPGTTLEEWACTTQYSVPHIVR